MPASSFWWSGQTRLNVQPELTGVVHLPQVFLLIARAGRLTGIGGRQILRLAKNPAAEALSVYWILPMMAVCISEIDCRALLSIAISLLRMSIYI